MPPAALLLRAHRAPHVPAVHGLRWLPWGSPLVLSASAGYFRFQRTPSFESSMTTPFSASSLRIWSARAKLRCFLAGFVRRPAPQWPHRVSDCRASNSGATSPSARLLRPIRGRAASARRRGPQSRRRSRRNASSTAQYRIPIARKKLPLVDGCVRRTHQLEDRRPRIRGIQVVRPAPPCSPSAPSSPPPASAGFSPVAKLARISRCVKRPQPFDCVGGIHQSVECEVELVPVWHRNQRQPDRRRLVSLEQQVAQGVKIPLAL